MKISMMNIVQHRELPADFTDNFHSIWVDPPWKQVASAEQYERFYRWSLEEIVFAAEKGFDAVGLNEHHQNAFGGVPNPNVFGGAVAQATQQYEVALLQIGATLTTVQPPTRVAEEYAMLDLLSGGRLIAGMPVGTPMDATLCYGVPPLEQRERYSEAHDLIKRAWTADEPFAFNGKYWQLPCVNVWPRPVQDPHPPVWVPGVASGSTWDFVARNDYGYMVLTAFSGKLGINDSLRLVEGFQERVEAQGLDENPFRTAIALVPVIGDSMAQIERDYADHLRYFFSGTTHTPPEHLVPPGSADYASALRAFESAGTADLSGGFEDWTFKDYVDKRVIIAGTADEVADQIEDVMRTGRAGHLNVLLQVGSMPKELTFDQIERFSEILPRLRPMWEGEYENRWWPARLRGPRSDAREPVGADAVGVGAGVPS